MANILKHEVNTGAQLCHSDVCSPEKSNCKPALEEDKADPAFFPGPLMKAEMQKEKLKQFINNKVQECLKKSDQKVAYIFWEIMDLFCRLNGKVMMAQIGIVLFRVYSRVRKETLERKGCDKLASMKNIKKMAEWCLPLSKLLCSFLPDVEHKESIIKMGDEFASKKMMWPAHISYVAARMELGTRSHFKLIGSESLPFGIRVMNDAIMGTEIYEYALWLTSGLGQANFQVYKLCYASRQAVFDFSEVCFQYCEVIARTIIASPDRFRKTFFSRVIKMSYEMLVRMRIKEKPEWLLQLSKLSEVADKKADADPQQQPTPPSSGIEQVQDSKCPDKISVIQSISDWIRSRQFQKTQADLEEALAKRYTKEELLGEGGFGSVHAGTRIKDGRKVAIKYTVNCPSEQLKIPGEMCKLPLEVALMKLVCKPPQCSNVVELLDWFATPDRLILVMERPIPCTDLLNLLESQDSLSEAVTRGIMVQVTRAVQHCRDRGVVHRDIKLENLLINTDTMEVKMIDFGCGVLLQNPSNDIAGTPAYCPPECLLFEMYEAIPAAVWGLGILMYLLVCGEYPFESEEDIEAGHLNFSPNLSKDFIHLVLWCLDVNPNFRPSLEDLLRHEWFTEAA